MKLSNIFKKENKTVAKANVEKLEKSQLEKVIGGGDDSTASTDPTSKVRNGGMVKGNVEVTKI